jgi:hypothetical protein
MTRTGVSSIAVTEFGFSSAFAYRKSSWLIVTQR